MAFRNRLATACSVIEGREFYSLQMIDWSFLMRRDHGLSCRKTKWHGRESFTLTNGFVRLITLSGGGHIAEFRFESSTGLPTINPLWLPPWETIEPYNYRANKHECEYGNITEGKLLSGIVGHIICLDYFGSPSAEEAQSGLSQHGEAPSAKWKKEGARVSAAAAALSLAVKLPAAGLRFRREIMLCRGESVAYFTEAVTNERKVDHFFHWTEHVTLGSPFLTQRESRIYLPAIKGMTFPHGYDENKALLASGRLFRWPLAPKKGGGSVDLSRVFSRRGRGFVVGVLLDPRREFSFVAALNERDHLLLGYFFRRSDFPWVAIWEENRAIAAVPWKQKTEACGLEFGTTPIPVSRRENFMAGGPLFGVPTVACVPSRSTRTVRYLAFLVEVPMNFRELKDMRPEGKELLIFGADSKSPVRVRASRLARLL